MAPALLSRKMDSAPREVRRRNAAVHGFVCPSFSPTRHTVQGTGKRVTGPEIITHTNRVDDILRSLPIALPHKHSVSVRACGVPIPGDIAAEIGHVAAFAPVNR